MSNSFNVNISACFDSVFSFLFPLSFELDTSLFIIKFSILFLRPRSSEIRILLFQGRIKVYLQYILEIFNFFIFSPLLFSPFYIILDQKFFYSLIRFAWILVNDCSYLHIFSQLFAIIRWSGYFFLYRSVVMNFNLFLGWRINFPIPPFLSLSLPPRSSLKYRLSNQANFHIVPFNDQLAESSYSSHAYKNPILIRRNSYVAVCK